MPRKDDILLWSDGFWTHRDNFEDDERDPDNPHWSEPFLVVESQSEEWHRVIAVERLRRFSPFGEIFKFQMAGEKYPNELLEGIEAVAMEALRLRAPEHALRFALSLKKMTRSSHAADDAQKQRAQAACDRIIEEVDKLNPIPDKALRWRADVEPDAAKAIAFLEAIQDARLRAEAQSRLVELRRKRDGRSLVNLRPIVEMTLNGSGDLTKERAHCRLVMQAAKKAGDAGSERVAAEHLYRVGVALTVEFDLNLARWAGTDPATLERLRANFHELARSIDRLRYDTHGRPVSVKPSSQLDHLSATDLKKLARNFGENPKVFVPFETVQSGSQWPQHT